MHQTIETFGIGKKLRVTVSTKDAETHSFFSEYPSAWMYLLHAVQQQLNEAQDETLTNRQRADRWQAWQDHLKDQVDEGERVYEEVSEDGGSGDRRTGTGHD